ncbi:MAG: penicillin acylase family protein [Desulfobacterales bacterium]|nr:penicillin acylase family protein [Desulfobacterales bacterium]
MKWLKALLLGVVALIAAAIVLVLVVVNPFGPSPLNTYQTEGTLNLEGLAGPVRILRDELGTPYIHAQNIEDLLMAQGFASAQDRLFQMTLSKLLASGRIGELVGAKARASDARMRTLGFRRQAQAHLKGLDEPTRHLLQRYADGVNAFIRQCPKQIHLEFKLAGLRPEPWEPADSLTILYFMGWNSAANIQHEIVGRMLVEHLGPERAAELFPLNINPAENQAAPGAAAPWREGQPVGRVGFERLQALLAQFPDPPLRLGSNNWAVAPQRSRSGRPIVAGDPHLMANLLPGPWYPCGLILPDHRAVGATIAGTPGIAVGRTQFVAFGVTNAYGDTQDLYIETVDPQNPNQYLEGERAIPFDVIEETLKFKDKQAPDGFAKETLHIRRTRRGPVVSDLLPGLAANPVMTIRWSAFEGTAASLGFEAFLKARNIDEFRRALAPVEQIMLNYVFADTAGNIGWQVSGLLPIRDPGGGDLPFAVRTDRDNWRGWVPADQMPQATNPPAGWVGTSNHKTTTRDCPYYYSNYFATSYRQERLMQLMAEATATAAQDHWQFQRDLVNLKAWRIAPIMARALLAREETRAMGRILQTWNGTDGSDQAGPLLFHSLFNELARQTYTDELGEALSQAMLGNTYFWEQRLAQMIASGRSVWFDDIRTTDTVESLDALLHRSALAVLGRLQKRLGGTPADWRWGDVHRYEFIHPLARAGLLKRLLGGGVHAADGSGDTLLRSKSPHDDLSTVDVMASLRMVADLADGDKVLAVLPGGVTGRLFHPHATDQIAPFLDGRERYWWFSDQAIQAHARTTLVLKPAPAGR